MTSLSKYTAPDSAQKMMNASAAVMTAAGSNSFLANRSPAKMMRFLVHWAGRSARNSDAATEGRGVPDTCDAVNAM
jgi:hypothetical protein